MVFVKIKFDCGQSAGAIGKSERGKHPFILFYLREIKREREIGMGRAKGYTMLGEAGVDGELWAYNRQGTVASHAMPEYTNPRPIHLLESGEDRLR